MAGSYPMSGEKGTMGLRRNAIRGLAVTLVIAACSAGAEGPQTSEVSVFDEPETTLVTENVTTSGGTRVTKTVGVAYGAGLEADIWSPDGSVDAPVAVVLHGSSDRSSTEAIVEVLVDGGLVVMNASWKPYEAFPDNISHAACAVRFARSRAPDFGGTRDTVILVGHSSGATAGAVISLGGDQFDTSTCSERGESALPDSFVGLAGGYDPSHDPNDPRHEVAINDALTYELVNPLTHLGSNPGLRVRLLHGDNDDVVPVESAIEFHQTLVESGYDASINVLSGSNHTRLLSPAFPEFETTTHEILLAVESNG